MPMKQLKFTKDEKVLCKHGPCVYPAKVLEVDDETGQYKVHYQGWNPKWDEMVDEDRLSKYTEEDAKTAAEENKKLLESAKKRKHGTKPSKTGGQGAESGPSLPDQTKDGMVSRSSTPSVENLPISRKTGSKTKTPSLRDQESPSPAPSESKRKRITTQPVSSSSIVSPVSVSVSSSSSSTVGPAPNVESEEVFKNKREIRIKIPEELRPILVDDWDLITKQMKIVRIPASPTVAEILDNYVAEKSNSKNMTPQKLSQICEITKGIRSYFDVVLGIQLLYKFERPQFTDVLQKNEGKTASEIYGFIHLLRLFVKFGQMLAFTPFDDKSLDLILSHLKDVLNYMKKIKPKEKDLSNEYETASPEYQRLAYT